MFFMVWHMWHLGTPSFPTLGFCFATFPWTAFRSPVNVFAVQCSSCYGYVGGLPATNFPPPTAYMHIDGGRRVPSSTPHLCRATRCCEGNAGGKPPWVLRGLVCQGLKFFGNTSLPHTQLGQHHLHWHHCDPLNWERRGPEPYHCRARTVPGGRLYTLRPTTPPGQFISRSFSDNLQAATPDRRK